MIKSVRNRHRPCYGAHLIIEVAGRDPGRTGVPAPATSAKRGTGSEELSKSTVQGANTITATTRRGICAAPARSSGKLPGRARAGLAKRPAGQGRWVDMAGQSLARREAMRPGRLVVSDILPHSNTRSIRGGGGLVPLNHQPCDAIRRWARNPVIIRLVWQDGEESRPGIGDGGRAGL
jgi:hypothetical protein